MTFGELLDRITAFEARLEAFYASIRDRASDNNVRFLSYYLSRHEYRLRAAIEALSPALRERVRSATTGGRVSFSAERAFRLIKTPPDDVTRSALIDAALRYDTELAGLYREVLEKTKDHEVSAVIEGLILMEERDIIILRKLQAMQNL